MAGVDPHKAFKAFQEPLQRALSCVNAQAQLWPLGSRGYEPELEHALVADKGEPVKLSGPQRLGLITSFEYRVVRTAGERGPWKVETTGYNHTLEDETGQEIITYQWHPGGSSEFRFPHLHIERGIGAPLGKVHKYHFPTGRVSFEDVLELTIREFKVEPQRDDWRDILRDTRTAFEAWRIWGGSGPPERETEL